MNTFASPGNITLSSSFTLTKTISTQDRSSIRCTSLSPDGRYLSLGYESGIIEVYDTIAYTIHRRLSAGDQVPVTTLSWHPHLLDHLVAGTANGNIHLLRFRGVSVDDIYERVKIRGYIHAQVWNPDGSQIAVIYGTEIAIILDPLSPDRFIHYIDMTTLIIPSLTTTISSAPLELHYFDEYSLFVVFLTEIIVVNTTQPFRPTWAIDSRKDSYFARVSISPDRKHIICNNLANGVDRYSVSDSNWLTTHSTNEVGQQARGVSRLYGVAFLDGRTIICGNNGSKLTLIYDTNRPGPNRYVFRNFQLDQVDRLTKTVITGSIRNTPAIIAINGEGSSSRVFVISIGDGSIPLQRPHIQPPETTAASEGDEVDYEGPDKEAPSPRTEPRNIFREQPPVAQLRLCSISSIFLFSIALGLLCIVWAIVSMDAVGRA